MHHCKKRCKITDNTVDIPNQVRTPDLEIKNEPVKIKAEPLEFIHESVEINHELLDIKHEPLQIVFGSESLFRINIESERSKSPITFCSCDKPSLPKHGDDWYMEESENFKECKKNRECQECGLKIRPEEKVFGTKSLLEKVLTYAVHTNNGIVDLKLVKKLRTIKKSWTLTTTRLLKKLGKPAIKLVLDDSNSLNQIDDVREKGKLLDRLVQTFTPNGEIVESALPFKLILTPSYFWKENYDSILNCLTQLGSYLIELKILYPDDGGSLPINFPNLKLPLLRKLEFKFSPESVFDDEDKENYVQSFGNNARGMWLLQTILNATEKLEEFKHPLSFKEIDNPPDFEFLSLPATVLDLHLSLLLSNNGLNVLLRNTLPKLKHLTLFIHDIKGDLLYRILARFQNTLKRLDIDGFLRNGNEHQHTHLQLPIMKYLETVVITTALCKFGPEDVSDLQECLPSLKCLKLTNQTDTTFTKWIQKSTFENVDQLEVSLMNENVAARHYNHSLSLDLGLLKKMHTACPKIRDLTLTFNVNNTSGLSYIFENMTKLQTLSINMTGNWENYSSDLFNSTLLGLPLETVTGLRKQGTRFKKGKGCNNASIKNLSELHTLVLWTEPIPEDDKGSLLTAMLFKHGLLKMKFLNSLTLYGKFKPTREISKLWKKAGGQLTYHSEWDSKKCYTLVK